MCSPHAAAIERERARCLQRFVPVEAFQSTGCTSASSCAPCSVRSSGDILRFKRNTIDASRFSNKIHEIVWFFLRISFKTEGIWERIHWDCRKSEELHTSFKRNERNSQFLFISSDTLEFPHFSWIALCETQIYLEDLPRNGQKLKYAKNVIWWKKKLFFSCIFSNWRKMSCFMSAPKWTTETEELKNIIFAWNIPMVPINGSSKLAGTQENGHKTPDQCQKEAPTPQFTAKTWLKWPIIGSIYKPRKNYGDTHLQDWKQQPRLMRTTKNFLKCSLCMISGW